MPSACLEESILTVHTPPAAAFSDRNHFQTTCGFNNPVLSSVIIPLTCHFFPSNRYIVDSVGRLTVAR